MSNEVRHNAEQSRYEIELEGGTAFSRYIRDGDTLIVVSTVTPPALRGHGLASRVVEGMLADARQRGLKIEPRCSFITAYFESHPEQRDLLIQS